ncbi:hypothetical protein GO730_24610 [Spirosoma sp. HMF3257]|uniref:Uncharacterized protein n=1 Tax=Spirosoma telluris TaxID=2183553 RepID=A0A327NMG6_9BACT|nr:hypothetical protein [Spirosoma telluris]RAI76540.1 hypothetical protein HMF3257_24550 [Spirosoma telluris]
MFAAKNSFVLRYSTVFFSKRSDYPTKADQSAQAGLFPGSVEKSPVFAGLCIFLLAIPIFIYYQTLFKNAYNFPYEDDFNSALGFIFDYEYGGLDAWGKLKLIFSQYNEHRIVFNRLIFLADYALFGELNFKHLILFGNLPMILIGIIFIKVSFPRLPVYQKLVYLLPVAYSLFLFQYWELATWGMAALSNLYVVVFAMISLYCLLQPGKGAFILACIAAVVATFTIGSGMFSFIAGIPLLILLKAYRKLIIWVILAAITLGLYFVDYTRPPYHPDVVDSLVNHTGRAISYFFTLVGSMTGITRPKLAILFGVLLVLVTLGLVGYLWYKKRIMDHLPVLGWLLFLYLTCLSLMASRSGMGVEQAFSPRYGIVVVMLFACQAILALEVFTQRFLRLGLLAAYFGIALFVYVSATNQGNRQRIVDRTRQLQYSTAFFNDNPKNLFLHWGSPGIAEPIFRNVIQKSLYKLPNLTFRDLKSAPHSFDSTKLVATNTITSEVKPFSTHEFLVLYRSWALVNNGLPKNTTIQLIAQSAGTSYTFDTHKQIWDDITDRTLGRQYTYPGFSCVVDKKDLKPGHYVLWLCLTDGESTSYQQLDATMDV